MALVIAQAGAAPVTMPDSKRAGLSQSHFAAAAGVQLQQDQVSISQGSCGIRPCFEQAGWYLTCFLDPQTDTRENLDRNPKSVSAVLRRRMQRFWSMLSVAGAAYTVQPSVPII